MRTHAKHMTMALGWATQKPCVRVLDGDDGDASEWAWRAVYLLFLPNTRLSVSFFGSFVLIVCICVCVWVWVLCSMHVQQDMYTCTARVNEWEEETQRGRKEMEESKSGNCCPSSYHRYANVFLWLLVFSLNEINGQHFTAGKIYSV